MKAIELVLQEPQTFIGKWLPVFLWTIVIFIFSSLKQISTVEFYLLDFILKKFAHLSEYAILFTLVYRATGKKTLLSFILTMLYAASDELHQKFVPGRTSTIYDLGFDFSGASMAAYLLWKLEQFHRNKPKRLPKN